MRYEVTLKAEYLPSGPYLYTLSAEGYVATQKMLLVR